MCLAFLAFEAPSKDVVIFASDITHGLYRLGYDVPFRPQDQLHFGDDLHGTVDTTQPQQDLVDAAPFFRCSTAQAACSLSDLQLKSFTGILPRYELILSGDQIDLAPRPIVEPRPTACTENFADRPISERGHIVSRSACAQRSCPSACFGKDLSDAA